MSKFKNKYRIESNRLRYWDYSAPGRYFLTNCTENRECIFGSISNKKILLSEFGEIVKTEILKMPEYHKRVILDEWIVMPNHIHLIIELGDYDFDNGIAADGDDGDDDNDDDGGGGGDGDGGDDDGGGDDVDKIHEFYLPQQPPQQSPQQQPPPQQPWWNNPNYQPTNDEIKQYRKQRRKMIIPKISGKMKMLTSKQINIIRNTPGRKNWQHDYYDHVIQNEQSYQRIKNYIKNNPQNWDEDKFNKK